MSTRTFAIELPMKQIKAFCEKWKVTEFALFGSILRDDFRPDSDVDVLLILAPNAKWSLSNLVQMQDELAAIFDRKVDILSRRGVEADRNYIRRKEILGSAQVIYESRPELSR